MAIDDVGGVERRTGIMLLQYWNSLRGSRDIPPLDEVDAAALPDLWGRCFIIDCAGQSYRYWGRDLAQAYEQGEVDAYNGKMVAPDAQQLQTSLWPVTQQCEPLLDEGGFLNPDGSRILYRQVFLPLGQECEVSAILGGALFKRA